MISFKEYHKQMEILNESNGKTKNALEEIDACIDNGKTPDQNVLNSLRDKILNGEVQKNIYTFEILKKLFDKNIYNEKDVKKIKDKLQELSKENYEKVFAAEESAEEPEKEPKKEEKNSPKTEDVETDINYLFQKKEKIQDLLNQNKDVKNFTQLDGDLLFYYIIENIIRNKMIPYTEKTTNDNINKSVIEILGIPIYQLKKKPGYKIGEEKKQKDENVTIINNFLNMLGELHDLKAGSNRSINGIIDDYCKNNNLYEKDINSPAVQKQIRDDIKNGDITKKANSKLSPNETINPIDHNKKKTTNNDNGNSNGNSDDNGDDGKAPELSSASKEGRERASDPNDVSSLSVKSTNQQIIDAVNGTFGTSPKNPGKIFELAIQRAENARAKIAKNVENDNQYMDVKDRKKELSENVILKELQTNPLLFEERKMLEEGIVDKLRGVKDNIKDRLNPTGRTAATRWDNALGKEDETAGSLEEFRLKMQEKADKVRDDITTKYVSDSTKADGIAKIKKYANDYLFGLNKKVNKLIKKNDYGFLGSMVRDAKIINADATRGRNEVYTASKHGKTREAEEKIILNNLNKLNDSPETIIEKKDLPYYKNILSLWAMMNKSKINLANMYTLDHPSKDLVEDLGPMEASVADKLIDFGKKYIYPGISEKLFKHIGTLLLNGNYNKLVDQSIGSNLRSRLENEIKGTTWMDKSLTWLNNILKNATASKGPDQSSSGDNNDNKIKTGNNLTTISQVDLMGDPSSQAKAEGEGEGASVVTEEYIISEDGAPISKSGTEMAILKALSMNPQEAAEGKQWIIDNVYKGNPLAGKIVDTFVAQNSKKVPQAAKILNARKQATQQNSQPVKTTVSAGTPKQVATAVQNTSQPVPQQGTQPVVNNQQTNTQQSVPQQNKPVNATVTTAAADGFPNRLYKKIIRRKIGF